MSESIGAMVSFGIFELNNIDDRDGYICIHGLSNVISEEMKKAGGCKKLAATLNFSEAAVKDWKYGRSPVPLFVLNQLLPSFNLAEKYIVLSVKRSKHKVRVPLEINPEFAYLIGLILGDGSLAGPKLMRKGAWRIHFCGDDEQFIKNYILIVERLFGIKAHFRHVKRQNKEYFEAAFASKVVHRLLTMVFEIPAGLKHDKIKRPSVLAHLSEEIRSSFLRGLFDTDGSVVEKKIKFATTSKMLCEDIVDDLTRLGFCPKVYKWKKGTHATLFDIRLVRKADVKKFYQLIGSSHPRKAILLEQVIRSW